MGGEDTPPEVAKPLESAGESLELISSWELTATATELTPVECAGALQRLGAELAADLQLAPASPDAREADCARQRERVSAMHAENSRLAYANERLAQENAELRRHHRRDDAELDAAAASAVRLAEAERTAVREFACFTGCDDCEFARATLAAHGGNLAAAVESWYESQQGARPPVAADGEPSRDEACDRGDARDDDAQSSAGRGLRIAGVMLVGAAALGVAVVAAPELVAGGAVAGGAVAARFAKIAAIATAAGAAVACAVHEGQKHVNQHA